MAGITMDQIKARRQKMEQSAKPSQAGQSAAGKPLSQSLTASTAPLSGEPTGGVTMNQIKARRATLDQRTQETALQQYTERHASDIGEVDARRDEMSTQLSNDVYAQVNNWKDASTRNRALYELVKKGKDAAPESTEDVDWNGTGVGIAPTAKQSVSDAELGKLGYRLDEIRTARAYVDAYSKLNPLETGTRRLVNTAKSVPASIAGGTAMMMSGLADKMVDSPEEQLTRRLKSGRYIDQQLADVYGADAVSKARERLESGKTTDDVRDEDNPLHDVYSWGRDTHKAGERLMADAMAGETETQRFWHGAATSAAENLVLAAINPALVLPVLSAQGAGDSMAQSDANGEGMTTALLKAGAKFGAGWAINSVGAADLARTMGSDYAKDTLAGQIADWVKGMAGSSDFAMAHPAVANAISGGMDNAMQAFVETYADKAIDAALGDSEAAENLFSKDTFLSALESGLSGGASGAMGGAVGTGLRGMSEAIDRASRTPQSDMAETAPHQSPAATASPEGEALTPQSAAPTAPLSGEPLTEAGQAKAEAPAVDATEAPEEMPGTLRETMEVPTADSEGREAPLNLDAETAGPQKTVENRPGGSAMTETADETVSANAPLRETVGLKEQAPMSRKQAEVRRALESWKVTDKAADTISKNMPENVDTEVYAAAASPLYRLGRAGAESFEQALELAGSTSGTAGDINYIMSTDSGKTALKIAYLQGKGEAMRYAEEMTKLGGELSDRSTGGSGQVLYKGAMRDTTSAGSRVIALNAAATGTDAVLKDVLQNDRNVKAYIDTEIGKIYFGDSAEDVFGTVLHEDWHWYNALDAEGARTLQEHVLEYLARNSGYESIDELIRSKVKDYGAQGLTYEQAAEELVADAWRGIFDSEESFKRWVEFQRGQAEKNAGKAGVIRKVMEKVRQMLDDLVSRAKEVLSADPDNRAAQKAKRLAEAEKRTLQDEYFAHAEKAMDTLRTAKENAAALRTESAAEKQGVRFKLHEGKDSLAEQMNRHLAELSEMDCVATVQGNTVTFGKTPGENIENIDAFFDSIGNSVQREGFGTVELSRYGATKTVRHGNSAAKQAAVAAIPEVIQKGRQIGYEKDWQGRGYDTYVFAAPVEVDGTKIYEGTIVNAYVRENGRKAFYVHEVCWTDGSYVKFDDAGRLTKKEGISTHLPMDARSTTTGAQEIPSTGTIAQTTDESKENTAPVKKTVRTQMAEKAEQADREAKRDTQRQASRVLAEKAAAFDTLNQFFGLTRNTRLSDGALESLALRWTKTNASRADRVKLANETRALAEYLRSEGADMAKAQSLAETLAGEVLDGATYRDAESWNEHPELHDLTYTVDKDGKAKAELVKRYGSWSEAVDEARKHGVKLRQEEGHRDGNPAEQYEAIVNETRAVGGTHQGEAALFRSAAEQAGVAGAASMESTEWLDVLMNVHDAIKPRMMSRFADMAEYEDAKVELAGRMIGDILSHPEMTDAEAVFEGILKHNREVAAMAAGSEEKAAEAVKSLRPVQQAQRKAFADRMRKNNSRIGQSTEARDVSRAEQHLDASLGTLGAQVSTAAGLDEKLTALREAYEREWKAEKKRMKDARREMLDEIELERRQHKRDVTDLARQVKEEQKRADNAEYKLLMRENDILEWEDRNQRKAEAWQRKQAQRNAIAIEAARQQRDEDVAVAKALAEKRVQRVREGRQKDELKRSIRSNVARLNQMALRPKPGKYIQKGLIVEAAEVAKLADMVMLNREAVSKLTALQDSVRRSGAADVSLQTDWKNSSVSEMIEKLRDSMTESKQAELDRLNQQLEEARMLENSERGDRLIQRLEARIQVTKEKDYLPLTVEQLRMLKAITASTLHVIRTENKTLSLAKAEEVDKMAEKAAIEVQNSGGNGLGSRFEALKGAANRYQLDMLGGVRLFRRLGGYVKGSQMEQLGRMLNDGQRRQTEILVKGEALFENVTGKAHLKQVEKFAGPGAELVDIGLKDVNGKVVPLNHAQLCSLYMHLRNEDSRHHLMTGGLTLPDAARYARGDIEGAYQRSQTVLLGVLTDADGAPMADTILSTVQDAMTDYDRAWCKDMEEFFGTYTTNLINETSMKLLGYDRATVKNYYPIAVDRSQLATEIEGLKMDATIEGRGFLRERVKSSQPILLEECQNVVKRSLRDTAAYAGLAAPIRDVQRILNSTVETAEGSGILKDKIIREKWGSETVNYINDLLTDLQSSRRKRSSTMSRALDRMRGNYAGAILTVNPGVAIAQAASLPTAGAVLGVDTMAAVMPFVKNLSAKQRTALEAEIKEHGDSLLQYRLRGTQRGELASIGVHKNLASRASEAMPALTGWISGMDEVTVAALWEGAKQYVEHHAGEFAEGAAEKGNEAYWDAVNQMYQRVIEETQPNYTTMQRAGIQRSDHELVKTLTMFTTQRFQNYGILADAVGDYSAQKARYKADQSAENRAEVERAGKSLQRAVVSQVAQTAVFALMKIGADFLLHRWDREQDENGDVTLAGVAKRFFDLYGESFAGNFLYGSEIYNIIGNAVNGTDYDVVSATNISAVNDLFATSTKLVKLWNKDTSGMSEEELTTHHQKLHKAELDVIQYGLELYGVPAANIRKVMQAFEGYYEDVLALARGEGFSFDSVPDSATGQYDRLYNAVQSEDSEEAAAALGKLEKMGKADQVNSQLTRRLKAYDEDILTAAKARNAGKAKEDEAARRALLDRLCRVMGDDRRTQLISVVNKAVNDKADELLKAEKGLDKDAGIYAGLTEELETGRTKDVQAEIDWLLKAGKDKGQIKTAITNTVKSEYLAGSDGDRERLEKKLLDLKDAEGEPLYEEKNFTKWVSDAEKEAEKKKNEKNWWD